MQQIGKVTDAPEKVSSPGYDVSAWLDASVPGTVLHSLVENGVYPDPYYGDIADFDFALDLIEDACEGLFAYLCANNH